MPTITVNGTHASIFRGGRWGELDAHGRVAMAGYLTGGTSGEGGKSSEFRFRFTGTACRVRNVNSGLLISLDGGVWTEPNTGIINTWQDIVAATGLSDVAHDLVVKQRGACYVGRDGSNPTFEIDGASPSVSEHPVFTNARSYALGGPSQPAGILQEELTRLDGVLIDHLRRAVELAEFGVPLTDIRALCENLRGPELFAILHRKTGKPSIISVPGPGSPLLLTLRLRPPRRRHFRPRPRRKRSEAANQG